MRPALVVAAALALAMPFAGCFEPAGNGWATQATQLDRMRGSSAATVRVAVLDSGIALGHPSLAHLADGDLGDSEVVAYGDFLGGPSSDADGPRDRGGHGTFVAGVLAADPPQGLASVTESGSAVQGLAPGVQLLVGRVCETGHCPLVAVLKGLEWAIRNDADVVSLSLGYATGDLGGQDALVEKVRAALQQAEAKGILVVAAAGNTDGGPVLFPAREPTVLAVGAMDKDGQPRASSARGLGSQKPDLLAPGEDIVGPGRKGGRVTHDGTSAAVPFVVATAALLMADADPEDADGVALLRQALLDSAVPVAGQRRPFDPQAGHGLLQAESARVSYAALLRLQDREPGQPPRPQAP